MPCWAGTLRRGAKHKRHNLKQASSLFRASLALSFAVRTGGDLPWKVLVEQGKLARRTKRREEMTCHCLTEWRLSWTLKAERILIDSVPQNPWDRWGERSHRRFLRNGGCWRFWICQALGMFVLGVLRPVPAIRYRVQAYRWATDPDHHPARTKLKNDSWRLWSSPYLTCGVRLCVVQNYIYASYPAPPPPPPHPRPTLPACPVHSFLD